METGGRRGRPPLNDDGYPAWMSAVHAHAIAAAQRGKDTLQELVRTQMRARFHTEAIAMLQVSEVGAFSYDVMLSLLVQKNVHFGEIGRIECTRPALRSLCMLCFGGIQVGRTRTHFQCKDKLEQVGITDDLRRCCLYCLKSRGVCVLESEWHFVLHCPLYKGVRSSKLRDIESGSEHVESPRLSAALIDHLSLSTKDSARLQSLGFFVRLSLQARERWLQENVSCGLQLTPAAQVGLPAAQLYSTMEAFTHGVALSL